ncbi:MAG TPA: helix-turn-helix transcriptional regulator [Tepidisphaeraceae bacterium]|nr:helix-turn-helix transcriptional regulator [Tepidisphaeraceae bacterium]
MPTENLDRAEVGRRIKQLRLAQKLSVQELASRARISPGYLSEVERGLSAVSLEKVGQIAAGLRVAVEALIGPGKGAASASHSVEIPVALSMAADQLNLSFRATLLLLQGKLSLTARRSQDEAAEWGVDDWVKFYAQVKDYLPDC